MLAIELFEDIFKQIEEIMKKLTYKYHEMKNEENHVSDLNVVDEHSYFNSTALNSISDLSNYQYTIILILFPHGEKHIVIVEEKYVY